MISSSDREAIVYVAELAKEAKRYEELAKEISKLAKMDLELTEYERNLLSIGYMNMVYARRTSLRTMSSIEQKQKMVAELVDICEEILYVIDNHLIPWHTGADSMVSYYKMKGDYNRCLAELKTGDDVKTFSYRSQYAYEVATNTAESELPSTHPTRLRLTQNIEVLFNEILDSPKSGMAEQAYDALDIQEEDDKSKSDPKEKQGPSISEEIVSQQDDGVFATKDRETCSQVSSEVVKRLKQQKPPPGEVDREQGSQEIVSRQDDCVAAATRGGETRSQVSSKVVKGLKQKTAEVSREGGSIVNSASIGVDSAHGRVGYAVVGLYSLGQTCFFNSVIQNLLAIDSLRVYFCKVEKDVGPVSGALRKIFLQTNIGTGLREPIVPRSLFECLRIKAPQFRENQQDDSHELLRCLLDLLSHEEMQPRKHSKFSQAPIPGPTFVNDLFGGRISSTITCTKCQHSSTCYEAYLDLSLTVPAKRDQLVILSVEGCLALFVEPEILSNDNGWHCENCSRVMREQRVVDSENLNVTTDATKRLLIDIAPPILTIHLKRFSKDAQGLLSKLNDDVSFREMIDLEPYMDTRCGERGRFTYRLVGVVEHRGVMEGGHYIAYVRGTKDNGDCVWYCTNDIRVREVSLEKVLCSKAYILFYERTRGSSDYHVPLTAVK